MVINKSQLNAKGLNEIIHRRVDTSGSIIMTEEYGGYHDVKKIPRHYVLNHQRPYVSVDTYSNTVEGPWASVKRSWYGQRHCYSRKWTDYCVSGLAFKYNNRKYAGAFDYLLHHMVGRGQ